MAEQDMMTTIYEGLSISPSPGESAADFVSALTQLYNEFKEAYAEEWDRLTRNEKIYHGDHWSDATKTDANEPQPTTPIVFSTVENIRADLQDEYPEAVIRPEGMLNEKIAKVLTKIVAQNHEAMDYALEYNDLTHDLLVGGYMVQEVGWDTTMNYGLGGAYIRHVSNKNILFDPLCANIQDGRAVFKIDRLPSSWFKQHYPDYAEHFSGGSDLVPNDHFSFGTEVESTSNEYMILLEAWIRTFDAEKQTYGIHMVQIAGGQLLQSSYIEKQEGYFKHGQYPFIVTPLYKIKGSPLGYGVVDMFANLQQYSDKLSQILLKNALTAGKTRMLVQKGACDDIDALADYSRQVVEMELLGGVTFLQDKPLPSYMMQYMMNMQQAIKEESGSNDFSRGNTTGGVTAASAITALQEMSSKRSRMEARVIHSGFAKAVRMELEVEREFEIMERTVDIMVDGQMETVKVADAFFQDLGEGMDKMPIEFAISIKPMRETRFAKLANNELVLQVMTMYQGRPIDPAIMIEAMEFDGKDVLLEKLRRAERESLEAVQAQLAQTQQQNMQLIDDNLSMNNALNEVQNSMVNGAAAQQAPADIPTTLPLI